MHQATYLSESSSSGFLFVVPMSLLRALSIPFILSLLSASSLAAIGPVTDLEVLNIDASPDGFTRRAISAGGNVTGALITGNKVISARFLCRSPLAEGMIIG
jgi:hypothetical protein